MYECNDKLFISLLLLFALVVHFYGCKKKKKKRALNYKLPKPFLMLALRISDQGPWKLEGHQLCFSCETSASLESYNNQQSTWIHSTRKLLVFQVYSLNLRPIRTNKQKNSKLQWSFYFSQSIVLTLMLIYLDVQSLCNRPWYFSFIVAYLDLYYWIIWIILSPIPSLY